MGGYCVERSIIVSAPASVVHALVDDFRNWTRWSPWEDLDPDLQRRYSGPGHGVGAAYEWSGNRQAGSGRMEITGSSPSAVELTVRFRKPFRATNQTRFLLEPVDSGTEVRWRMTGEQKGLQGILGKLVSMEKMIGPDFEKGLIRLKTVAEQPPESPRGAHA